ncbi:MAG: 50S ribosomal protein L1 [Candidatus Aureabacteria bacterium]|nr:50S ribosomal protein L1 [Candidatus Auribacterota bacterium]
MTKKSKRFNKILDTVDRVKTYELKEALKVIKESSTVKFDETVEMSFRLGVDPRKSDQMVRGVVSLPHGTGKTVRVLVLAGEAKAEEARGSGADYFGSDDMIEKIQGGWTDFDVIIATPDMMKKMGRLGKILGPKGLMPSPKAGTVTQDIGQAVKDIKKGKIEFKVDKNGNLHLGIGKVSFDLDSLYDNAVAVSEAVSKAKPKTSKGVYIIKTTVSSTMGIGLKVDQDSLSTKL